MCLKVFEVSFGIANWRFFDAWDGMESVLDRLRDSFHCSTADEVST